MRRRNLFLVLAALGITIGLVALSAPRKQPLLVLQWAGKGDKEKPPVAVLIELGLKDRQPTKWTNQARVKGARVVHREGYRFRAKDRLVTPDGWNASSHRALRVGPGKPELSLTEGIATIGVVLHLRDVADDATLTLTPGGAGEDKAVVALKDVLAGKPQSVWGGSAVVRLVTTTTLLHQGKTEDDFPAAAYGPDGTLWVAYIAYRLRDESRRIEQHPLKEQPASFKALYKPDFSDQLFVKYLRKGKWSAPLALTGPNEDLVRCAVAVEKDGTAWVAYSSNRHGKHHIYARAISPKYDKEEKKGPPSPMPGPEQQLTAEGGPYLSPVLCTAQDGQLILAFQANANGTLVNHTLRCQDGAWRPLPGSDKTRAAGDNCWAQAVAAGPDGKTALAFDHYRDGDYDIRLKLLPAEEGAAEQHIASSAKFEARPSLCYDSAGRLWIAYEEGPERWGKDYGALVPDQGSPLYSSHSVRVVCLQDGKLYRPAAELPTAHVRPPTIPLPDQKVPPGMTPRQFETAPRYSYPRLGLDGKGRLWLTYRQKFGTRYSTHPGSYWLTFARRLDGDHWTEPVEVHHSDGLLDHRPVLLPHASGGLLVVFNGDNRYTKPNDLQNRVYTAFLDLPGAVVEPKLVPHEPGEKKPELARNERAAIERIRGHRIELGGKKYQLLRGDFHRHTEISWDGGPDGSLEDFFRYALDAAGMDWIGNCDHDSGAGREYAWWLIQKFSDAYHLPGHFTPMYTYERSVSYPHGHRNVMFAKRGVMTLPRLAQPDPKERVAGIHADDTKMLYRYLHELGGICAVHTSATGMGTDWRDNDPEVEPFVEIYQGDRMSYEKQAAPRAGYNPKTGKLPANIAGWYPLGYINLAFDKGYRFGFQSSSDHWSTHISYGVALAEGRDRESILAAFRRRHCYAATDDIVLDVRSGKHLMGDSIKTEAAPTLQIQVRGTDALAAIDILEDGNVIKTITPGQRDYKGAWTAANPKKGSHGYYVRVRQKDGQLAWSSPIWFERGS